MSGDAHTEPSGFTLLYRLGLQLANKHGLRSGLGIRINFIGHTVRTGNKCIDWDFIAYTSGNLHLPGSFHFANAINTLHMGRQLGVVDNTWLAGNLDQSTSLVHAIQVCGSANVFAAVLGIYPAEVHGHIAKIVDGLEAIFCMYKFIIKYFGYGLSVLTVEQGLAIKEPFDLHVRITYRRQLTLEFGFGHLRQCELFLDLGNKARWLFAIGIEKIILG